MLSTKPNLSLYSLYIVKRVYRADAAYLHVITPKTPVAAAYFHVITPKSLKDVRTIREKLTPFSEKCPHWLNPLLSIRTHHKFRKIWSFCTKKCELPQLKNPPCPKNSALDKLSLTADVKGNPAI